MINKQWWAGIDQTEHALQDFFQKDHSNDTRNIKCNVTNSVDIINLGPTVKRNGKISIAKITLIML